MFKNYLILFSFLLSTAYADQINEIVIDGNKRISDETIKVYGEIGINKDLSERFKQDSQKFILDKFFNDVY